MYYVFFLGTAGSGKTTLVKAFSEYLEDIDMEVSVINVDPAVEELPYSPDFDIRSYVDAREVMRRFGLGPNSALVTSVDLALTKAKEIKEELDQIKANYVLVDTPGQIELFAFRETGRLMSSLIRGDSKAVGVFLLDGVLSKEARSYVSLLLLSSSVRFRLDFPVVNALSKVDLLTNAELEKIKSWSEGTGLIDELGKLDEYSFELVKTIVENLSSFPVPVSGITHEGLDDLYGEIQNVLAGGEDYLTEEPNPRL
ncbi:MAG: ATP/GTP-binding protein [Thermoprotei archaeon]